jgi:hypothetical protein
MLPGEDPNRYPSEYPTVLSAQTQRTATGGAVFTYNTFLDIRERKKWLEEAMSQGVLAEVSCCIYTYPFIRFPMSSDGVIPFTSFRRNSKFTSLLISCFSQDGGG